MVTSRTVRPKGAYLKSELFSKKDPRFYCFRAIDIMTYIFKRLKTYEVTSFDLLSFATKNGVYYAQEMAQQGYEYSTDLDNILAVSYSWKERRLLDLFTCLRPRQFQDVPSGPRDRLDPATEAEFDPQDIAFEEWNTPRPATGACYVLSKEFVWLDIININQNSRHIGLDLACLPLIYQSAKFHIVSSLIAYERGWCCYEIAVRGSSGQQCTPFIEPQDLARQIDIRVLDPNGDHTGFVTGKMSEVCFKNAKFTVESDRDHILKAILESFGTVEAFDMVVKNQCIASTLEAMKRMWKMARESGISLDAFYLESDLKGLTHKAIPTQPMSAAEFLNFGRPLAQAPPPTY
eukprot:Colp12_sorted_trinity150504_noHs@28603